MDKYQDMSKHQALYDAVIRARQDERRAALKSDRKVSSMDEEQGNELDEAR